MSVAARTTPAPGSVRPDRNARPASSRASTVAEAAGAPVAPSRTTPSITAPASSAMRTATPGFTDGTVRGASPGTSARTSCAVGLATVIRKRPLPSVRADNVDAVRVGTDGRATTSAPAMGLPSGPVTVPSSAGAGAGGRGVGAGAAARVAAVEGEGEGRGAGGAAA